MPPGAVTRVCQPSQIVVFSHNCSPQAKFFCFKIPPVCPTCQENIDSPLNIAETGIQMRTLPCPLKSANSASCALAIRPSNGHFLFDYENESDLHICLITSDGRVVEYDQNGARMAPASASTNPAMASLWDEKLEQFVGKSDRWTAEAYDAQSNNCFDFVLEFLRSLNLEHLQSSSGSKTVFCENYIVPKTRLLARYISLFRKVQAEKVVRLSSHVSS